MSDTLIGKAAVKPGATPRLSSWLALVERRSFSASLLSGALAALALPPFHIIPGLLGFALWLILLAGARHRRETFLLGWWFGLGYFVVGLYWIAIAFFTDAEKFGALALPAVLLLCAVMAVFPGSRPWPTACCARAILLSKPLPWPWSGSSANGCAPISSGVFPGT